MRADSTLFIGRGAQILRFPEGSQIKNLSLSRGASACSPWAILRGGVLKGAKDRKNPILIDGQGLVVPPGYVLMDARAFWVETVAQKNRGEAVPHKIIQNIAKTLPENTEEPLFLVDAGYSHPESFLRRGSFPGRRFFSYSDAPSEHGLFNQETGELFLLEAMLPISSPQFDILEQLRIKPTSIHVCLKEGGKILLASS